MKKLLSLFTLSLLVSAPAIVAEHVAGHAAQPARKAEVVAENGSRKSCGSCNTCSSCFTCKERKPRAPRVIKQRHASCDSCRSCSSCFTCKERKPRAPRVIKQRHASCDSCRSCNTCSSCGTGAVAKRRTAPATTAKVHRGTYAAKKVA